MLATGGSENISLNLLGTFTRAVIASLGHIDLRTRSFVCFNRRLDQVSLHSFKGTPHSCSPELLFCVCIMSGL